MFKASSVRLLVTPLFSLFFSFFSFLFSSSFVCAYSVYCAFSVKLYKKCEKPHADADVLFLATRVHLRDLVFKKMRLWGDELYDFRAHSLSPPSPLPPFVCFFVCLFVCLFLSFLSSPPPLLCLSRIIWFLFVLMVFFKSWKSDLRCSNQPFCARIYNTYFR